MDAEVGLAVTLGVGGRRTAPGEAGDGQRLANFNHAFAGMNVVEHADPLSDQAEHHCLLIYGHVSP